METGRKERKTEKRDIASGGPLDFSSPDWLTKTWDHYRGIKCSAVSRVA